MGSYFAPGCQVVQLQNSVLEPASLDPLQVPIVLRWFAWKTDYEAEIFMLKIYKGLPSGSTSVEE